MKKRKCNYLYAAILTTGLAMAVAGCSSAKALSAAPGNASSETMAAETAAAYDISSKEAPSMPGDSPGLSSENSLHQVNSNRKLIRNVELNVETTNFDTLLEEIAQSVSSLNGYLERSDISGNSISSQNQSRYANMTVRVPSNSLDAFIAQVESKGNITSKTEYTEDVTLQYSDVESRKKSLTIEQDRLWALLEKAESVDAIITLEARLSEIRYELESLESQLRLMDNQVDYSTITMWVSEVNVFTPTSPDTILSRIEKGFARNLNAVSSGLINFIVWFISSLPLLIFLAILGTIAYFAARHLPRHNKKRASDTFQRPQETPDLTKPTPDPTDKK